MVFLKLLVNRTPFTFNADIALHYIYINLYIILVMESSILLSVKYFVPITVLYIYTRESSERIKRTGNYSELIQVFHSQTLETYSKEIHVMTLMIN